MQGLRQQILTAASAEVINELLTTGKTYGFASRKTRNSWKNASNHRMHALKGTKAAAPVVVEVNEDEAVAPTKKRGNKKKLNAVVG